MKLHLAAILSVVALAACDDIDNYFAEAEAEQEAADLARCERQGFQPGTEAMARCLDTISREREAERALYAEEAREAERRRAHSN